MVQSTVVDLRLFQWGKETTPGTLVAATSKILVPFIDFEPTDNVVQYDFARGLIQRNKGFGVTTQRGTRFTIGDAPWIPEQGPNWLSMSVSSNGNTPTGAGPYVYAYSRNPAADPAPTTWTLERRLNSGVGQVDHEWGHAFLTRIGWKGPGPESPVMFNAEGVARRVQASTFTPALSFPSPVNIPQVPRSVLSIDSAWANLGVTPITGQMISWEIDFRTGLVPIYLNDGRSDLDWGGYVFSSPEVQLNFKVRMLVKAAAQYATEKTAAEAGTLRAVRVLCAGDNGTETRFDLLLRHKMGSVFKVAEYQGQDVVDMEMEEDTDGTNLFAVRVTNNISTIV